MDIYTSIHLNAVSAQFKTHKNYTQQLMSILWVQQNRLLTMPVLAIIYTH